VESGKNKAKQIDDTVEIQLTRGQVCLIDAVDWDVVRSYRWSFHRCRTKTYAKTSEPLTNRTIYMHRFLLGEPDGVEVDHVAGAGLDNRRSNLRLSSALQNQQNRAKRGGVSSRFKGVTFNRQTGRWRANITEGGKQHFLGSFDREEDAASAYDQAAVASFGEFARPNFPP
jgi:hypothetical protein